MYQAKSGVKIFPFTGGGGPLTKNFFFQSEHVSSQIWCQNFSLSWGGVPWQKIFFSSLNMYQAKSGVKIFSLYQWGEGSLDKKFFFQSEHVSSQIWCQKFFPLLGRGGPLTKKFFLQSKHVSSQIWCQNFFPLPVGGWGRGCPLTKNFFSSLNMYQAKSGVKIFSLYRWGDGVPWQKIFFSSLNMYQAKSGVKIFSLYRGGVPQPKILFFQSEHVSSQIWCKNFFPLPVGGMGSLDKKNFFPVWTCMKPNLVSKFFPFTVGGSLNQKFCFSSLNMYQAKSGVKIFSLYQWGGVPWQKIFFSSLNMYQAKSGVKNFSLYWEGGVPWQKNFFCSLNMYQAKSGVKIFSLYQWGGGGGGGVPWQKFFFPVWTCIKPNLV